MFSGAQHLRWSARRGFGTVWRILNDYASLRRGASAGVCTEVFAKRPDTPSTVARWPPFGASASLPRARVATRLRRTWEAVAEQSIRRGTPFPREHSLLKFEQHSTPLPSAPKMSAMRGRHLWEST